MSTVNERLKALIATGCKYDLVTEAEFITELRSWKVKAILTIRDGHGGGYTYTGYSCQVVDYKDKFGRFAIECADTIAKGKALAAAGYGIDERMASEDEIMIAEGYWEVKQGDKTVKIKPESDTDKSEKIREQEQTLLNKIEKKPERGLTGTVHTGCPAGEPGTTGESGIPDDSYKEKHTLKIEMPAGHEAIPIKRISAEKDSVPGEIITTHFPVPSKEWEKETGRPLTEKEIADLTSINIEDEAGTEESQINFDAEGIGLSYIKKKEIKKKEKEANKLSKAAKLPKDDFPMQMSIEYLGTLTSARLKKLALIVGYKIPEDITDIPEIIEPLWNMIPDDRKDIPVQKEEKGIQADGSVVYVRKKSNGNAQKPSVNLIENKFKIELPEVDPVTGERDQMEIYTQVYTKLKKLGHFASKMNVMLQADKELSEKYDNIDSLLKRGRKEEINFFLNSL
jgi:hypothetical protein